MHATVLVAQLNRRATRFGAFVALPTSCFPMRCSSHAQRKDQQVKTGTSALLELRVVRWHGHYEGDPQQYRDSKLTRSADPLEVLIDRYPELLTASVRRDVLTAAKAEMDKAVEFARGGGYPDPALVFGRAADASTPT